MVAVKQRNLEQLEELFWAVSTPGTPQYRMFKTTDEINKIVAPAPQDIKTVIAWLAVHGVASRDVSHYGDAIEVSTTIANVEKLFAATIYQFTHAVSGRTIERVFGSWRIDVEVRAAIDLIEGLIEFPIPHLTLKKSKPAPESLISICPQSVNQIYKVPSGTKATGNTSICPAEWEDQFYNPPHLQAFAKSFSQTIAPISSSHIVGHNDPKKGGGESTLDVEYALGIGAGVTGWYWVEGNGAWLYTYAVHVTNTTPAPYVFTISYGWSEADQCAQGIGSDECKKLGVNSQQYVVRVNTEFQKIGLRGISLFVASGDSGANGRTDPDCTGKKLLPDFPAASPYVTSVGATMITEKSGTPLKNPPPGCKNQDCGGGGEEVAVSYAQAQFTSGGGFSWVAAQPSYQTGAVANYFKSGVALPPADMYNAKGRGYPDVAAFGSQVLEEESSIQPVGGTSCSSPIFSGLMSILNGQVLSKTGKPLGFLNPLLYKMAYAQPSTFTDITVGDNKCTEGGCSKKCQGFEATKGWDPVSGLGSPVFSAMQTFIQATVIEGKW